MAMTMINGVCDGCGDTDLPMTFTTLGKLLCLDCREDLADIQADRDAINADHEVEMRAEEMERRDSRWWPAG